MKPAISALFFFLSFCPAVALYAQTITTIAGTPTVFGFSGAGGPATSIVMREPFNVAVDNGGNVFFTDPDNNRIWKVNTAGIASIYAGTGVYGHTGDGGPATSAAIEGAFWLTVDNTGNLYFSGNTGAVRRIDASGIISTLITAAQANGGASMGDGGPLSAATFIGITGFVPDNAGNFYISDYNAGVVRKVNSAGIINAFAGTGVPGFSGDGGPAALAQLKTCYGVAFDHTGNIYIPDAGNGRIRKIDAAGIITTVAGKGTTGYSGDGGPATNAEFYGAWQVAFDGSGNMFIDDAANNCVRKVDNTGMISTYAGVGGPMNAGYSGDGGPANAARMTNVTGIAVDNGGNLYIADQMNFIIRKVNNCLFAQIAQQPAGNTICAGGNTNFAVTATGSTGFQWQFNSGSGWNDLTDAGVYSGTTTNSLTITSAVTGMNGFQYRCAIVNGCGTIATVPAVLTVNTPSAPTVVISTATGAVCAGTGVLFTASATNGGVTPSYQWQLNGANVGTNSATYTNAGWNNGDVVSCVLTSNSTCATTPTANSNSVTMTVNPLVTPGVSIATATPAVCAGTAVSFTASATNGGVAPSYQWQVNGANVGTNSDTYVGPGLNNGDAVSCVLTSNAVCATTPTATSNSVRVTVNPLVTPGVSIATATPAVCAGTAVSFTASATNGGVAPSYQWQVNGADVGTNNDTYANAGLNTGDVVSCVLTSNAVCATAPTAGSNSVTMTVNPLVTPAVSIATATPFVCAGTAASFTASATNGGVAPAYQWLVNGVSTGAMGASYISSSLNNGDAISCIMTSNAVCPAAPTAVSNTIVEQVRLAPNTSVSIAALTTTICSGAQASFTATPVNGGPSPGYQWQVNGNDVGADKAVFTTNGLVDGDVVSCILTGSLSCSVPTASQNQVVMTVNANPTVVPMPDTIIGLGQSVVLKAGVTGPVVSYQWMPAVSLDDPYAAAPVATPENTTTYRVIVTTGANCTASGKVTVGVFKAVQLPGAFTPNGDGRNDLFRMPPSTAVKIRAFVVYDRWGTRVFYTSDSSVGWDGSFGGRPQPTGTYVWVVEYEDPLTKKWVEVKGAVVLVR
ncbi:MAG: gliding motility-associated C-terminal domain-containing protein [Sphingobacteriales bacterium]|nr:gliding motility-associated C-terminal domain-containing protein [Sphingobacteriales bacterium]